VAVGSQTLAVTVQDGRRRKKWPLVHRPLAVTDRRRRGRDSGDILGGYRVWFVFGEEGRPIRIKQPPNHTRWTPQIRGKDCSICSLYIPSQPEVVGGAYRFPTNQELTRLQRRLLRRRGFPGSRAKCILHNKERCIMGLPLPRKGAELQGF